MAKHCHRSHAGSAGRRERIARTHWRDVLSLCLLALFALQGIVAQGHTHTRSAGAGVIMFGDLLIAKTDEGAGNGGAPNAPDSANCGLCQSLSAGTAPLAVAILFLLPPAPEAGPEPRFVGAPVLTVAAVSYFWTLSRSSPLDSIARVDPIRPGRARLAGCIDQSNRRTVFGSAAIGVGIHVTQNLGRRHLQCARRSCLRRSVVHKTVSSSRRSSSPRRRSRRTATRWRRIVDSVDRRQILQSGGANLADALANEPGVTGTSFAAGASRPVIRGFDANRVRVLENGIGSFDVSDVGPDHGVPIDPLSTEKIELVRGAATLRYGSQAIGGVVNAINNRVPDALPDKPVPPR